MEDNRKHFNLEIHPTVFWVSAGLMVFFVLATLTNLERARETFNAVQSAISTSARPKSKSICLRAKYRLSMRSSWKWQKARRH